MDVVYCLDFPHKFLIKVNSSKNVFMNGQF